jgi:hypothetical protein
MMAAISAADCGVVDMPSRSRRACTSAASTSLGVQAGSMGWNWPDMNAIPLFGVDKVNFRTE